MSKIKIRFRAVAQSLINTFNKVGEVLFTNERNLYIVGSNGSKIKITDVIFVNNEKELESLNEYYIDKIYITKDSYKMYTWTGVKLVLLSGGGSSSNGTSNSVNTTRTEVVIISYETYIVTVPFEFTEKSLKVYRNGVLQNLSADYYVNNQTITFSDNLLVGDVITLIIDSAAVIANNAKYNLKYIYNSKGKVEKEVYSGGVNREVLYSYDSVGNKISKTVIEDGKTITANYKYDLSGNLIEVEDNGVNDYFLTLATDKSRSSSSNDCNCNEEAIYDEIYNIKLDIIKMQLKYDIALDLTRNQCGDYFIDTLKDDENIEEFIGCNYSDNVIK